MSENLKPKQSEIRADLEEKITGLFIRAHYLLASDVKNFPAADGKPAKNKYTINVYGITSDKKVSSYDITVDADKYPSLPYTTGQVYEIPVTLFAFGNKAYFTYSL